MFRTMLIRAASLCLLSLCTLSVLVWAQKSDAGKLRAYVNPGRTAVFVDGKYLGPAANFKIRRTYVLPAGEHKLLLADPRCKDYETTITVKPGKATKVIQVMEQLPKPKPPFGRLRIVQGPGDKFGAVFLNEKYMGHIDEFSNSVQGLLVRPGEYELKIAAVGGGQDHTEKITIKENQTTTITAGAK